MNIHKEKNHSTLTIAIIVRTKNRPHLLTRCLTSLAEQSRQPDEVIIVNDGGQPIASSIHHFDTLNIHLLNYSASQGRARAGNLGAMAARSDIIGFLDDDDRFLPDHLQRLEMAMCHFDTRIAYSGCLLVRRAVEGIPTEIQEEPLGQYNDSYDAERLRYENYIPLINLLIERQLWQEVSGFDESFDIFEDWDVLLRLAQKTSFYHVDRITTEYSIWGKSQITRAISKAQWIATYRKFLDKHLMSLTYADKLDFLANYWMISQERRGIVQETTQEKQALQIKLLDQQQKLLHWQQQISQVQEQNSFLQRQYTQLQTESAQQQKQLQEEWSAKYELSQTSWGLKYDNLQTEYKQVQTAWASKYDSLQAEHRQLQVAWADKYESLQRDWSNRYETLQRDWATKHEQTQTEWAKKYAKTQEESEKRYEQLQNQTRKQQTQLQKQFSKLEEEYQTLQKAAQQQIQQYETTQNALHELSKRMAVGVNRTTIENIFLARPPTTYMLAADTGGVVSDYRRLVAWIQAHGLLQTTYNVENTDISPRPLSTVYPTFVTFAGTAESARALEQITEVGTVPFLFDPGAVLVFTTYCSENNFLRLDLMLATRLRINTCQVRVIIRELITGNIVRQVTFSAIYVFDNRFHSIEFAPILDSAGKTYQIEIDSPDANEHAGIAAWCHTKKLNTTHAPTTEIALYLPTPLPQWVQQSLLAVPLSPRLTAPSTIQRFMVRGISPATPLVDIHLFLMRLDKALAYASSSGNVTLCGQVNRDVEEYCQQNSIRLLKEADSLATLLARAQTEKVDFIWCCEIYALPRADSVKQALDLFASHPKIGMLIPLEQQADGKIRAGIAALLRDGLINTFSSGMPADHPYQGYRRVVEAANSTLIICKRSRLPHLDFRQVSAYQLYMYQVTELIWQLNIQRWDTVYEAALCYDHNQPYPQPTEEAFAHDSHYFYQRWRIRLPNRFGPFMQLTDLINPYAQPTLLIIDATLPMYDEDSGSFRLFTLMKIALHLGYRLTFFPDNLDSNLKYRRALEKLGIEVFHSGYGIHDALAYRHFDFALICRVDIGHRYIPFIRLISPETVVFYDTVDIHYIREQRQAEIENNQRLKQLAEETKRRELSNCLLADHVITVTEDDGRHLQQELPHLKFSVIPNVHPAQPQSNPDFNQRDGLVFIGNYNHLPNEDAVYFFIQHVLPKIQQKIPTVRLYLIGSNMKAKMKTLAGRDIEIIGWVDKVEPEFAKRRVFVSYLRYGAGMKGKLGQALSVGLPVVTTTVGAEGMGLVHGETALIADDPDLFSEAVCRLYTDSALWQKLSQQGRDYVERQFGETAVREKLRGLLKNHSSINLLK